MLTDDARWRIPGFPRHGPARPGVDRVQALGHHLGDAPLVHLGHPQLPVTDGRAARLRPGCGRRRRTGSRPGSRTPHRGWRCRARRARSSTLVRPSTSHRLPSTRTTSGSSSGSNSSARSPTSAPSRSFTVMTPSTPPCSSTTTAKARRCRRISASTSRTSRDSGTRKGCRSRRERSMGPGPGCPRPWSAVSTPTSRRHRRWARHHPWGCARRPSPSFTADHPARSEQVIYEEHTDQVVEVVEVDRKAAVTRLPNGSGHGVDGQRQREGDDVDPGGHDLPNLHVPKVVEGVDDELLLLVSAVGRRPPGRAHRKGHDPNGGARGDLNRPVSRSARWRKRLTAGPDCSAVGQAG